MTRYRTAVACLTVAASLAVAAPAGATPAKNCKNIPVPGPICHPPALP